MVPKCIHIWQGQVTYQGTTVNSCVFPKLPHYPSDSKPNTVACSKFEFPLNILSKGYRNSHKTYVWFTLT